MAIRKKTRTKRNPTRAAIMVLHRRVEKLERWQRRIEGERRRIGFETDVRGDTWEMDDEDAEIVPDEVP